MKPRVVTTLALLLGAALGALATAQQDKMQSFVERLEEAFTMPIREVPSEEMLVFGVDMDSGRAPLYQVVKFRDGSVTCYVLWGDSKQLSCVK